MEWQYELARNLYKFPHCELSKLYPASLDRLPHVHLHHNIELIYVTEGSQRFELYESDKLIHSVMLHENDVILVNCNVLHDAVPTENVRYYLALIPPNSLMNPLGIEVGKTCSMPYNDSDKLLLPILDSFAKFSHWRSKEPNKSIICTSLANTVLGLLLPRLGELIEVRGGSMKADILTYIYQNYRNPELSAEALAKNFGYSKRYLSQIFYSSVGMGLRAYLTDLRINDAKNLLGTTSQTVESIAYTVGFESLRSFFRTFNDSTGMTPGKWRELSSGS